MPDEHSIHFPQTLLSLVQKSVDSIFGFHRVVQASIPDENLHLQKNMLCPFEIRTFVLGAVVSQAHPPIRSPGLQSVKPLGSLRRAVGTGEKHFAGRRWLREIHYTGYGNESMAGLPFIGRSC